jgi:hypothetical protein
LVPKIALAIAGAPLKLSVMVPCEDGEIGW